jgi:uncharacterized membrane protein YeaQ/YmgE (transglycosylase-associated protein family)
MGFIAWVLVGLVAGFLASIVMKTNSEQGMLSDIVIGMVGAVLGGFLMNLFGADGADGFSLYSIFVATLGAIVLIGIKKMFETSVRSR